MRSLTPSAQEGAEGLDGVVEVTESPATVVFDGPAPALWAGFASFVIIFFIVIMLIIRGRVVRPAKAAATPRERNYFEPAGEDADITFDEETKAEPPRVEPERTEQDNMMAEPKPDETEPDLADPTSEKKKKSAFSGLFAKKATDQTNNKTGDDGADENHDVKAAVESHDTDQHYNKNHGHRITGDLSEEPEPAGPPITQRPAFSAPPQTPPQAQDDARIALAESAAAEALRRADDAEAIARDLKRANADTERALMTNMRQKEDELNERAAALTAIETRLNSLSGEVQHRLDGINDEAVVTATGTDEPALSEAHFAEFADLLGEQFDTLRNTVSADVSRLSQRIDQLQNNNPASLASPTDVLGALGASTAARIQLKDLLADALPPGRYTLGKKLSSGRTADACINMPGGGAIAVDARFPVEAFDAWVKARNHPDHADAAETELRRIVLRHVVDAAEKLIAPGETASSALMFIPSEYILSAIHAHFPDLVQASYRANVWMTAPTSLMATLHTISAVMTGAPHASSADNTPEKELEALTDRVRALEARSAPTPPKPASTAPTTSAGTSIAGNVWPAVTPSTPLAHIQQPGLHVGNPEVTAFPGPAAPSTPTATEDSNDKEKPSFPLS